MEHVLRECLIALGLGERIGLDGAERATVYYAALLTWVGCHVDAYEQATWFGDDLAFKADFPHVDGPGAGFALRHLGAGRPLLERARLGVTFPGGGRRAAWSMLDNHRLAAEQLASQLGLGPEVQHALRQAFERWDGRGTPGEVRGTAISITSRLVSLADVVEVYERARGIRAAIDVARERSGTQFDPSLVEVFCRDATALFEGLEASTTWEAVIAAEPELDAHLSDEELDATLEAIANFTDLKSPYTHGHSVSVAELAEGATRTMGLPDADATTARRAGLLHDLGRLGVSNAIWDKRGPLAPAELERVRLHPYLTERMLASSEALARLGSVAVQHHERLDGSGYPRGATGGSLTPIGRVLAAADTYRAKLEPRPHRPELAPVDAASHLLAEVTAGKLDGDAVAAVLTAAGHPVRRRRAGPAGLTAREVDVLRLAARGLSTREIAERLVISRKTVANHVEHIYAKIGVSNRARASLFAAQHGLLGDLPPAAPERRVG